MRVAYIPPRRDKKGKRFGFVKFKDVHHVKSMIEQLSGILIGIYKLIVNLPKSIRKQYVVSENLRPRVYKTNVGMSYAEAVEKDQQVGKCINDKKDDK